MSSGMQTILHCKECLTICISPFSVLAMTNQPTCVFTSRENPERTFDLVVKVKCQTSENEGNVLQLLVFIYRN